MKRFLIALAVLAPLSGCGIFSGAGKPKTALLGERVAVLTYESGAEVDATLATTPVTVPAPIVNADWTQPGGNETKAMGHLALGTNLAKVWSARIEGSTPQMRLAASPVVGGGRLYVVDTRAMLRAFDAQTGALIWSAQVGAAADTGKRNFLSGEMTGNSGALFGGGVSFADGRVYATNGIGDAAAFDAADGKQIWLKRPGGPLRGAPAVAGDRIYVVSQDNQIFSLAAATGELQWNQAATLEVAGVFGVATPAIAQGTVVAGYSSGELNAYRYENGRIVWGDALARTSISTAVSSLSDIDASPVIDNGRVFAVGQGGRMIALELVTGQRLWELNLAGLETPWAAGEWLFVVTDDARLLCITRNTGKVRWLTQLRGFRNVKSKRGPIQWSGPVLAGGRLIVASSEDVIEHYKPEDGTLISTQKADGAVKLPPIVANNMLYILTDDGRVTAYR